jgi:hypothetical protein
MQHRITTLELRSAGGSVMPPNAADRKSVRRLEKAAKLAESNRRAVITQLMSTAPGREWVWDILAQCHCFATTFNGDALTSAFAEGERNVGLRLLADILAACPDQYIQAQRESNDRNSLNERRSSTESDGRDSEPSPGDDPTPSYPTEWDDRDSAGFNDLLR